MVHSVLHAKKGISELIAAMILILIAIAGGIIVYIYSSGVLGSLQGARPQQQYVNQISLEFYDWTTTSTLKLTLRNVGSGQGILADFFVSGSQVFMNTGDPSNTCTDTDALLPGSACTAVLDTSGLTVMLGVNYIVRVVTRDGSVFSYSCIAGQSTGSFS